MRSSEPAYHPNLDLLAYRVLAAPSAITETGTVDCELVRSRMLPIVAACHAVGAPISVAWLRHRADGPVCVLVSKSEVIAANRDANAPGERQLHLPLGARGTPIGADRILQLAAPFKHWVETEVSFDANAGEEVPVGRPTLDDLFAWMSQDVMAVSVVATPSEAVGTTARLEELSNTIAILASGAEGRGKERLAFDEAEQAFRYLDRWSVSGLWTVRIAVGSDSEVVAQGLAASLGQIADTAGLPFRLEVEPRKGKANGGVRLVSGEFIAAFARSPARELAGLRVIDDPGFDITPEPRGPVVLGNALDSARREIGPVGIPLETLNRHSFVTGATGSGKSQTVRRILESLTALDPPIPWLVIEPAKSEFAQMAGRIQPAAITVIRPGDDNAPPVSMNPLEPSAIIVDGKRLVFPLQTHLDLVRSLFNAAFDAQEPFPQILAAALSRCYEDYGWDLATSKRRGVSDDAPLTYPVLSELQRAALDVVDGIGYGEEIKNNVRGFVTVRINSLRLGTSGRFFEGGHAIDLRDLLSKNVVFEIEDVGDDQDKAFFIGTVIIRIYEIVRLLSKTAENGDERLRHVIVLEEAHRLLRKSEPGTPSAHAVEMFANLLAEVRAYGEGVIVAEQIPEKIISDVVKNSALKIMHRLPALDDREFVGATMNLSPAQSTAVVALRPGIAAFHCDGMDRPILVAVDARGALREREAGTRVYAESTPACAGCREICTGHVCNLTEFADARHLADDPRLLLWAELTVVSCLTFASAVRATEAWLSELRRDADPRLGCAISQAAQSAVIRRYPAIQRYYNPNRLASHVSSILRAQVEGSPWADARRPEWAIGEWRWRDIALALVAAAEAGLTPPHADVNAWVQRGVALSGATWKNQQQELDRRSDGAADLHDTIMYGNPRAVPTAVARLGINSAKTSLYQMMQLTKTWITTSNNWHLEVLAARDESV